MQQRYRHQYQPQPEPVQYDMQQMRAAGLQLPRPPAPQNKPMVQQQPSQQQVAAAGSWNPQQNPNQMRDKSGRFVSNMGAPQPQVFFIVFRNILKVQPFYISAKLAIATATTVCPATSAAGTDRNASAATVSATADGCKPIHDDWWVPKSAATGFWCQH